MAEGVLPLHSKSRPSPPIPKWRAQKNFGCAREIEILRQGKLQRVENNEVVTCAVHLPKWNWSFGQKRIHAVK